MPTQAVYRLLQVRWPTPRHAMHHVVQAVYGLLQARCAPRLLVDRGTENARSLQYLRRAPAMFADLRVVHLCRHPYSVRAQPWP